VLHQPLDIQPVLVENRAIVFDDTDDLETRARHQLRRHAADVSQALHHHPRVRRVQAKAPQRL
jgi:hypothetical protein